MSESRIGKSELTSTEVNDACWAFIEAMPHQLPGPIWNDLKPAVHAAICKFISAAPAAPVSVANSPQAEQQAEREPLTDEQAAKLITEATGWQSPLSAHYCIVRIIERTLATRWGVKIKESNQ